MSTDGWDDQDIAAWVACLGESLVRPELATQIARQARTTLDTDPARGRLWLAGVIGDLVASLPQPDPWRHLSARVPVAGGTDIVLLGTATPPAGLGAASAAGEFGTWRDGVDLVPPAHANLLVDSGLIALAEPLEPASAALLALCGSDFRTGARALEELATGGPGAFDIAAPALRWAAWRRRVYTGPEDTYPMTTGFMWLNFAARLAAGEGFDDTQWQADRESGALPAELYDPVTY